jgi:acyl-coenzyme A thioesterase PaaI-like protein
MEASMTFDVPDPDFEPRIRKSFSRQGFNERIGAILGRVTAGYVEIEVPFSAGVTQQHRFFHGGVMGVIGDSACGYAAMTLTPRDSEVLTIEYKITSCRQHRASGSSRAGV